MIVKWVLFFQKFIIWRETNIHNQVTKFTFIILMYVRLKPNPSLSFSYSVNSRELIALVEAEKETFRFIVHLCSRGFLRVIVYWNQRARPWRFWCQDHVLWCKDSRRNQGFGRQYRRKIINEHLYDLGEVGSSIWIFHPTWTQNYGQFLWEVIQTRPHILTRKKETNHFGDPINNARCNMDMMTRLYYFKGGCIGSL